MEITLQCQIHPYEYFVNERNSATDRFATISAPESFDPERKIRENDLWQGFSVQREEVRPGGVYQTVEVRGSDLARIHMRLQQPVFH